MDRRLDDLLLKFTSQYLWVTSKGSGRRGWLVESIGSSATKITQFFKLSCKYHMGRHLFCLDFPRFSPPKKIARHIKFASTINRKQWGRFALPMPNLGQRPQMGKNASRPPSEPKLTPRFLLIGSPGYHGTPMDTLFLNEHEGTHVMGHNMS